MTGCGRRVPLISSPVIAIKTLTVRAWKDYQCHACGSQFDVEAQEARMAPGVPLVVSETEGVYAVRDANGGITWPDCMRHEKFPALNDRPSNKKIQLTLLMHPDWLKGTPKEDTFGREYGGTATDSPEATELWNRERARTLRLVEVRGVVLAGVTCPQ